LLRNHQEINNTVLPLGAQRLSSGWIRRNISPSQQQLVAGNVIAVLSMDKLPPEAARDKDVWHYYGINSSLVIPLSIGIGPPVV
jgi:hypothetical protein